MKNSILKWSVFAAWLMAIVYDRIEQMTGMEIDVLLAGAVLTMVFGMYTGLYWKGNVELEEDLA